MKNVFFICILLCVSISSLYCQNRIISGRVINDQLDYMPMVSIFIEQNIEVGKTDLEGFFQIEVPISVKKLSFFGTGLETTSVEFANNCLVVEVIMLLSGSYDFISLKKVNKLRKKRFKNLPNLHAKSFEMGIFKTKTPCYIQEFLCY